MKDHTEEILEQLRKLDAISVLIENHSRELDEAGPADCEWHVGKFLSTSIQEIITSIGEIVDSVKECDKS